MAPTSPGLVPRPGLVDRLERGASGPVTVVVAPAGTGKSALVRSWLLEAPAVAWVSVERGARDAQRFWSAVIEAVRAAVPLSLEAPAPTPELRGDALVLRLADALERLGDRIVLVFDDLHEIASAAVLAEVALLLDHLPESVHLVVISRRDPQLGLHRLQLEGGVNELRAADLRFGLDEARQLLTQFGVTLTDGSLRLLHERTEGWAAGLRLASISLRTHPDPERFVREFSGSERTVAGYLIAEVLDSMPPDVRRLLVRTSILKRVNGPLGDLLAGGIGSERRLREVAAAGGFVIELDAAGTWFRLHHLFADLLAAELRHTEPADLPGLHRAAATWHSAHGDVAEAVRHAQAAGDQELAVGLLIDHYFSLELDGLQETAHALVGAFAPEQIGDAPELATVMAADELAQGSLEQAAAHLALAERHAEAVPEERRHRWAMAQRVTRLSLAQRVGDYRLAQEELSSAGRPDDPHDLRDIAINTDVRTLMLMHVGIAEAWAGRVDQGSADLDQARKLAHATGRPYLEVACLAHIAQAESWYSFAKARSTCEEALALADVHGWGRDAVVGPALVVLAITGLQAGRLEEARGWLERATGAVRPELEPAVGFLMHMARGAIAFAGGAHADAVAAYQDAETLSRVLVTGSPLELQMRCAVLLSELGQGKQTEVRAVLEAMDEVERGTGEVREVAAALALAGGDASAALTALAPTLNGDATVHHPVVVVRSALLEATARDALDEPRGVEGALERALDVAEPDALVLPFLRPGVRELLEQHPRFRTAHGAFIAEILDIGAGRSPASAPAQAAALLEPLSDAELRVLRFLPTNLSAAGIADELYVSVNTVKTHMRHIYAKLDAHSRFDAVDRGRALGLLGHSVRL